MTTATVTDPISPGSPAVATPPVFTLGLNLEISTDAPSATTTTADDVTDTDIDTPSSMIVPAMADDPESRTTQTEPPTPEATPDAGTAPIAVGDPLLISAAPSASTPSPVAALPSLPAVAAAPAAPSATPSAHAANIGPVQNEPTTAKASTRSKANVVGTIVRILLVAVLVAGAIVGGRFGWDWYQARQAGAVADLPDDSVHPPQGRYVEFSFGSDSRVPGESAEVTAVVDLATGDPETGAPAPDEASAAESAP